MSKATKQTKATVAKAVEETKPVEQTKPVETKATKAKVETKPVVVEQPKVEARVEDHEDEQEVGDKKAKQLEFASASAANEEMTKLMETIASSSKRLAQVKKVYDRLLTREMRQSRSKKSDRQNKAGSKSGFNKPQAIPEHIRNFLNNSCKEDFRVSADDLKPRTWITKAIYSYIHDNKLTAENNGRKIIANKVLADLFGVEEKTEITFESFQTMVSQAFRLGQESGDDEESGSGEEVVEVKKSATKVATK